MVILTPQVADDATANQMGGLMSKAMFAALLAAGLIAAPLPALLQTADRPAGGPETSEGEKAADRRSACGARAHQEVRRRMEGHQGRRQGREGNEVAAILARVQQAPQGRRLTRRAFFKTFDGPNVPRASARLRSRRRPLLSSEPARRGTTVSHSSLRRTHRPV